MTEWNEFRDLDFEDIKKRVRHPVLIDAKNIYHPETIKQLPFLPVIPIRIDMKYYGKFQ